MISVAGSRATSSNAFEMADEIASEEVTMIPPEPQVMFFPSRN